MQRLGRVITLCALVTLGVPVAGASTQDELPLETLVREVQERYRAMQDLRAQFRQRRSQRVGARPIERTGTWMIRTPGRMRVEYDGSHRLLVADGERIYWYLPEDNQVHVYPSEAIDPTHTPTLYLTGEGDLRAEFYISGTEWDAPLSPGNIQVRLDPKASDTSFAHMILEIEPATRIVARLVWFGLLGESSDFQFFEVETDVGLAEELFQFTIPPEASVEYFGS